MHRNLLALAAVAVLLLAGGPASRAASRRVGPPPSDPEWPGYQETLRWESDLDVARARARAEGKLLFVFHLSGNLDKGC